MPTNYDRVSLETTGAFTVPISYSTLSLFDNIAHIDQVEVYRTNIQSIYNTEFSPATLTLNAADKARFGIIKPEWITYNESNKTITAISIPTAQTFTSSSGGVFTYPAMVNGEPLEIRRRTVNSDVLVEWITGSRITAEQLNLLSSQLLGISQENLYQLETNVLKADDANVTYATPEYVDSSFNALADLISLPSGIENANDRDKCLVVLSRISSQNIPQAASNLKWDVSLSKMQLIGQASQTENRLELLASNGVTLLNYFNPRGVLNNAGRVFYGNTTPTAPAAADTGLLWWDTTGGNQVLKVWNGTGWDFLTVGAGSYVTLSDTQTISGAKTFSAATTMSGQLELTSGNLRLSGTVDIRGIGVSKSIELKPTNASSTQVTALTLTSTATTVPSGVNLDYFSLGTNAKAITCTISDAQTLTGIKTFNTQVIIGPSSAYSNQSTITTTDNTTGGTNLVMRTNKAADPRYIRIFNDSETTNGIELKSKNNGGNGRIYLNGPTTQSNGDFTLDTTSKIRKLENSRIPGSRMTFVRNGNNLTAIASLAKGEGLDAIPECTVTCSQSGTAPYAISVAITNTGSQEQKYKINWEQIPLSTYPQANAVITNYSAMAAADTITLAGGATGNWSITTNHSAAYNATNASIKIIVTVLY